MSKPADSSSNNPGLEQRVKRLLTEHSQFPHDAFVLDLIRRDMGDIDQYHIVDNLHELARVELETEEEDDLFYQRYSDPTNPMTSPAEAISFHATAEQLAKYIAGEHAGNNSDGIVVEHNGRQVTIPYGVSFDSKMQAHIKRACDDPELSQKLT